MAGDAIVLDSGALTALAGDNEAVRVAIGEALRSGSDILVPTVVIAESTTGDGGRDARVNRVLKALVLVDLDETIARAAAALRHANRLRRAGTIDAIVVATADRRPRALVLTSDADDLRPLAAIAGRTAIVNLAG